MEWFKLVGVAASVAVLVSGLISYLFKQWIAHERDLALERAKTDFSQHQTTLATSINSQLQAFHAVNDLRMKAVMKYWDDVSRVLRIIATSHSADRYLRDSEIEQVLQQENLDKYKHDWIGKRDGAAAVHHELHMGDDEIGRMRPLIGEQLWFYRATLLTFGGRLSLLYSKDNPTKKWLHWRKDTALVRVARQALTEDETNLVLNAEIGSVATFGHIIEQKVLVEIGKILSGEVASVNTLQNAQRLQALSNETKVRA